MQKGSLYKFEVVVCKYGDDPTNRENWLFRVFGADTIAVATNFACIKCDDLNSRYALFVLECVCDDFVLRSFHTRWLI